MKNLILVLSLFCGSASAWEVPNNPDRCISLGFNVSSLELKGTRSESDLPLSTNLNRFQTGPENKMQSVVGLDLKIPVHPSITVDFYFDQVTETSNYMRQGNIYELNTRLQGNRYGFSARMYFNK